MGRRTTFLLLTYPLAAPLHPHTQQARRSQPTPPNHRCQSHTSGPHPRSSGSIDCLNLTIGRSIERTNAHNHSNQALAVRRLFSGTFLAAGDRPWPFDALPREPLRRKAACRAAHVFCWPQRPVDRCCRLLDTQRCGRQRLNGTRCCAFIVPSLNPPRSGGPQPLARFESESPPQAPFLCAACGVRCRAGVD